MNSVLITCVITLVTSLDQMVQRPLHYCLIDG